MSTDLKGLTLGINGLGRVGKNLLWTQIARQDFGAVVVNIGRKAGNSLQSIIDYILHDSTYGSLNNYLFGATNQKEASIMILSSDDNYKFVINGLPVAILTKHRVPKEIEWQGANIVVDTTGKFNNPAMPDDDSMSVRGHFYSESVKKIIVSSPFKLKSGEMIPKDATTIVLDINEGSYDSRCHDIISNASCTTTCLAHMLKPLVQTFGVENLQSVTMQTIHAFTGKQQVLDRLPKEDEVDPVKFRATHNNIFLTTTGAAKTLELVMPEIKQIPFTAFSARIPTNTGSVIFLVANWNLSNRPNLSAFDINQVYEEFARVSKRFQFTNRPVVSTDIIGSPKAAAIIDGNHTAVMHGKNSLVTTLIYGWYDNELGSYINILADQAVAIARSIP